MLSPILATSRIFSHGVDRNRFHKIVMALVNYSVENDIAIIEVNNPPVNALSHRVREGLVEKVDKANNDASIKAAVVVGHGAFLAGADLTELKDGKYFDSPQLQDVADYLEKSSKPLVAAIHEFALGGGMEVAISCHYRVAHHLAQFGFPEVDIGLLPAATGTQRFPRLVGLKLAFDLIPTGRRMGAKEALEVGAIDKVTSGDVLQAAIQFARSIAARSLDGRRTSQRDVKDKSMASKLHEEAVQRAKRKAPGRIAPINCIDAVMAAAECDYEEGLAKEMELAMSLITSPQAAALQYAFFAQRAAAKWEVPGTQSSQTVSPQKISTSAVIGAGTMGTGIAMTVLKAGIPVLLLEKNQELLNKGVSAIQKLFSDSVALGKMSADQAKTALSMLRATLDYTHLKDVDVVIEAVFEKLEVKRKVFAELNRVCKPAALLATNTSGLSIDLIAEVTGRPDKVIGLHFFMPAYHMKLLEVVRGAKTSAQSIATAVTLGTRLDKVPVVVGNGPGFASSRMRYVHVQEAEFLLEDGSYPEEVDYAMEHFGFPLGPLKVNDLAGIDIHCNNRLGMGKADESADNRYLKGARQGRLLKRLVKQGRLGRETGRGFYNYDKPGGKIPANDSWLIGTLFDMSRQYGQTRRGPATQIVTERLLLCVVNEAFKIMEEGVLQKPEEVDTIWLLGLGFPRHLGGPMYWSNTIGIKTVYNKICKYYKSFPTSPHWQPADTLRAVAENDVPMKNWYKYAQGKHAANSRL